MSLPITVGNWTFEAENHPTSSTTKTLTLTVPNWADYSLSTTSSVPSEALNDCESAMYYMDTTGTGLRPAAQWSIGRKNVRNIYGNSPILASARIPSSAGVRGIISLVKTYAAVNTVSAAEYEFAPKMSLTFTDPSWASVPKEIVEDMLNDFVSFICSATDPAGVLLSILRGDLDLTR